jgi:hypothetical protein
MSTLKVNVINEQTAASGVTIEGLLLKDGNLTILVGTFTVGQLAGPLLTFNDSDNFLGITGCSVGIGTVSPGAKLEINHASSPDMIFKRDNSSIVDGDTLGQILFQGGDPSGSITASEIISKADGTWDTDDRPSRIEFLTAAATGSRQTRLLIDKDGNVGIGIASPVVRSSFSAPWINVASIAPGIALIDTNNADKTIYLAGSAGSLFLGTMNDDGTDGVHKIIINDDSTVSMPIYGAGTATFDAAGLISSVSDEDAKIHDKFLSLDQAYLSLEDSRARFWYNKGEDGKPIGDRQLGEFAQDIAKSLPEAAPHSYLKDDDGNVTKDTWGIYDRSLVSRNSTIIKDIVKRMKALEAA